MRWRSGSIEREKSELAVAGPIVRIMETVICAIPFTVPREALFGEAAVMKIKTQPERHGSLEVENGVCIAHHNRS